MRKHGESKTTRIMMATVPRVTSGSGLRKFQADVFLFDRVYHIHYQFKKINLYFGSLNMLLSCSEQSTVSLLITSG